MKAIEFKNVRFSYTDEQGADDLFASAPSFALDGIDLSVEEGEFVAILGHNGSGKSTLARLTNGLLSPDSGEVYVLGMDATDEKNLFEIRKNVGVVFQNPDNQTVASIVEDDVAFGPENVGIAREEIGERIAFALQAVGMEHARFATTSRLSGGQKQRIAIAGVLALKPRVMILDESTAMLDPRGRKEVIDVVKKLNREEKITVVLITHFPEEALLADRAIVMNHGKIVMQGTPQEILSQAENLTGSGLVAPRSVRICRKLQENGLAVADAFTCETLAAEIAKAVANSDGNVTLPQMVEVKKEIPMCETNGKQGEVVCENLSYTYNPSSPFETHALNGADLHIQSGSFFGILGHTGSGKSTFVQHLNALLKLPTAEKKYKEKKLKKGEVPPAKTVLTVNGFDLTDKRTDFKQLRKKVGMVFQYPEYQLFAETVFDDVAFGLRNYEQELSQAEVETAVREAIETVGLSFEEVKNRSPFELSGGQKRRVAIAGVIVTKPEILVLDEPAAGLDPLGKEEIMRLLHDIHAKWCKTVIIVSHDMDEIAENCTSAAVFSGGAVLAAAQPSELFADAALLQTVGLDLPFVAKTVEKLQENNVDITCDYTVDDFVYQTLKYVQNTKTTVAGTRATSKGGAQ
jgi:energy-coupling factor transport system ATP-binding protein